MWCLQSPVQVSELDTMLQRREQRVVHRREGIEAALGVLRGGFQSQVVVEDVLRSVVKAMWRINLTTKLAFSGAGGGADGDGSKSGAGHLGYVPFHPPRTHTRLHAGAHPHGSQSHLLPSAALTAQAHTGSWHWC